MNFNTSLMQCQDFRLEVDMHDVSLWKKAINQLKTHSARGCDKISSQELKMLPTQLIQLLADVMMKYEEGFPTAFMQGLTVPLARTTSLAAIKPDQSRSSRSFTYFGPW